MISVKDLLSKQIAEAFEGRADMPLMASLAGITQREAEFRPNAQTPSIDELVRHIAWAKSHYCQEGFGVALPIEDPSVDAMGDCSDLPNEFPCGAGWGRSTHAGIDAAVRLLREAQRILVGCLDSCDDAFLEKPIPTRHGKSAAHFFWIMAMHDLYHAGQIRTRRTMAAIA